MLLKTSLRTSFKPIDHNTKIPDLENKVKINKLTKVDAFCAELSTKYYPHYSGKPAEYKDCNEYFSIQCPNKNKFFPESLDKERKKCINLGKNMFQYFDAVEFLTNRLKITSGEKQSVGWSVAKTWFRSPSGTIINADKYVLDVFKSATNGNSIAPDEVELVKRLVMEFLRMFRFWHGRNTFENAIKKASYGSGIINPDKEKPRHVDILYNSAGSELFTSDIDTNLRGPLNELVVPIFNDQFRKDFDMESGILYDENAYGVDYLDIPFRSNPSAYVKEIYPVDESKKIKIHDKFSKEAFDSIIWAMLKFRMNMRLKYFKYFVENEKKDSHYIVIINQNKKRTEEIFKHFSEIIGIVNACYWNYLVATARKIFQETTNYVSKKKEIYELFSDNSINNMLSLEKFIHDTVSSKDSLKATNKIYERLLITKMMFGESKWDYQLPGGSETSLQLLRNNLIALAVTFSNEAHISKGAVLHVVGSTQMKVLELQDLSTFILYQSWTEQWGFIIENFEKFSGIPAAAKKDKEFVDAAYFLVEASKYLVRIADITKELVSREIFPNSFQGYYYQVIEGTATQGSSDTYIINRIISALEFVSQFEGLKDFFEDIKIYSPKPDISQEEVEKFYKLRAESILDKVKLKASSANQHLLSKNSCKDVEGYCLPTVDVFEYYFAAVYFYLNGPIFSYVYNNDACFQNDQLTDKCKPSIASNCKFEIKYPLKIASVLDAALEE